MIYEGKASNILEYMNKIGIKINMRYNICDAFML